jgi:hypothetical protein
MLAQQREQRESRTSVFHSLIDYKSVQYQRNRCGERPTDLVPGSCEEHPTSSGGITLEEGQASDRRSMTFVYLQGVT